MKWGYAPAAALGLAAAMGITGITGAGAGVSGSTDGSAAASTGATDGQGWEYPGGGQAPDAQPPAWVGGEGGDSAASPQTLSATAQAAAQDVTASVVNIDTVLGYGAGEAAGTGIVIGAEGLVLTNHHVVEGATTITGTVVGTGTTYTATVVGYDSATDVAVLGLTDAGDLPVATLADADSLDVGDLVVGVGNAGGAGGRPTAVEGVVTELGSTITATDENGGNAETLDGLIGTNADIQSGQSGGPLVDASGDVVGVDVAASSLSRGSGTSGYAIPIDDAMAVAGTIIAGTESGTLRVGATAFLGVQLADSATSGLRAGPGGSGDWYDSAPSGTGSGGTLGGEVASGVSGVAVAGVVESSAAEGVGLRAGDTITTVDGSAVTSAGQLSSLIGTHDVGDQLSITWVDSSGSEHAATARLGEGPVG